MRLHSNTCAIKRGPPSLEAAVKAMRRRRTATREAAAQLVHIANCQFQLQRALEPDTTCDPLPTCGGYPFQGLRDAKLRIDEAIEDALRIRNENPRAMVYSEIFDFPGLAAEAIAKWDAQLSLSRNAGDAESVRRCLAWLDKTDNKAAAQIDKAFAFLDRPARYRSPKRFDKQILALAKS